MKKIISVMLAVLMLFSAVNVIVYAENPFTGETKYKVNVNPLDDVKYTFTDNNHDEQGYYEKGAICEFTVEVASGYEMTEFFLLSANGNYLNPVSQGDNVKYYSIVIDGDVSLKVEDGSVMKHVHMGLLDMLIFWFEFIFNYLSRIIKVSD